MDFKSVIRTIPDYPKPGIMFRDITTLAGSCRPPFAPRWIALVAALCRPEDRQGGGTWKRAASFLVVLWRISSRSDSFLSARKAKLPHSSVIGEDYDLEYGTDRVEIHIDAIAKGERVLLDG